MTDDNLHDSANPRKSRPARRIAARAAERRIPKMHWRWCKRGRDIVALLDSRFGSALPDDDAGMDAVKFLVQHYMGLKVDAERVTRSNLRLWAHWLTEKATAAVIKAANETETPSAAKLGKHWRVTIDEVAVLGLETITAFAVTREQDRTRQARRRRKAGAKKKRGRPSLGLSSAEKKARTNAQAAGRMRAKRARSKTGLPLGRPKNPLRKNSHAPSYIRAMKRDELSVTELQSHNVERGALQARPPAPPRPTVIRLDGIPGGLIIDEDGHEFEAPPPYQQRPVPRDWFEVAMAGYRGRS